MKKFISIIVFILVILLIYSITSVQKGLLTINIDTNQTLLMLIAIFSLVDSYLHFELRKEFNDFKNKKND